MKDLSNENVIHVRKDSIEYLQFRKLLEYQDEITHAFSLGIDRNYRTARSQKSLTETEQKQALKDYKDLCKAIGMDYINVVKPCQTHTNNIKKVDKKINENNMDFSLDEYSMTDGISTNKKNINLATTSADCIIILFFDPIKKAISNIHSGWKGTLKRISTHGVNQMKEEYGSNPSDIICCICPSIRKCHFEVREDVQELYYNEFKDLERIDEIITKIPNTDKWYIDTVEINKIILKQVGLKEENIIDSGICNVCNSDLIHSYRIEKEGFGLNTAVIGLK